MRITILTWGTRGEVQPYLALGHELERRGHRVVLAVNENHVEWTRRAGMEVAPLPLDFQAMFTKGAAAESTAAGKTGHFLACLAAHEHERRHAIADAMIDACAGADAIMSGFFVSHRAAAIAQAGDTPFVRAFVYPVEPTATYSSPYLGSVVPPFARAGLCLRTHEIARAIFARGGRADLDELRARLGLPPLYATEEDDVARRGVVTVHLYDERVLPRPEDWPARCLVGGYCFLPHETRDCLGEVYVAPELAAWLDAGSPPIFFGFGSMPILDPQAMLGLVESVCRELGVRALIDAGWSRLPNVRREDLFVAAALDHDAILPRCRAAVHHGGAGTTGASLAAGVPTVIASVFGDQTLWGHRVAALRVGATMPFQRMTGPWLMEALRDAISEETTARARSLGAELRAVDGRSRSADLILEALFSA